MVAPLLRRPSRLMRVLSVLLVLNAVLYREVRCGKPSSTSVRRRRNAVATVDEDDDIICRMPGCSCKTDSWTFVNCTFNATQKITLDNGQIPSTTMELYITGGDELTIKSYTFNASRSFGLLKIDGMRTVRLQENAFFRLNVLSFKLMLENTDRITLDSHTFRNSNATISAEIRNSSYVQIKDSTFCRLLIGRFQSIVKLDLSRGAFRFENQGSIGRHGPVANLSFMNVKISVLPRDAFSSSMSEVTIKNSEIYRVESEAFSGGEINIINFINCTIGRIGEEAISSKTLIYNLKISTSRVIVLESKSVMAGIKNLTIEHSRFGDIETGVTGNTIANVLITDNDIRNLNERAFVFRDWNTIHFDYNIVLNTYPSFIEIPAAAAGQSPRTFTFRSNELYNVQPAAFDFLADIDRHADAFLFQNNSFNGTCTCSMREWFATLTNGTGDVDYLVDTSFCRVIDFLSRCYQLGEGLINVQNFTDLVCDAEKNITCEPYRGETKVLNTTAVMLLDETPDASRNGLYIGIGVAAILAVVLLVGLAVVLAVKGGIWLKRKGYCMQFRNMRYNPSDNSNDDEGAMVDHHRRNLDTPPPPPSVASHPDRQSDEDRDDDDADEEADDESLNLPGDLTPELLQALRAQLENPETEDQAREMIEKLYEMYIIDDGYGNNNNNNRQEDETHLYEELGNLQQQNQEAQQQQNHQQQDANFQNSALYPDAAINFLRFIEEKFNNAPEPAAKGEVDHHEGAAGASTKPALVSLYSEPKDAAVHLYSELNDRLSADGHRDAASGNDAKKSKSNTSTMAFRPLPDKPSTNGDNSNDRSRLQGVPGPSKAAKKY